jgi:hypothetical protein
MHPVHGGNVARAPTALINPPRVSQALNRRSSTCATNTISVAMINLSLPQLRGYVRRRNY